MGKVLPEYSQTSGAVATSAASGLLGGAAELVEVLLSHDGCKLGVHSGFPSIGSNVDLRMHCDAPPHIGRTAPV